MTGDKRTRLRRLEDRTPPLGGVDEATFRQCVRAVLGPKLASAYLLDYPDEADNFEAIA